MISKESSAHRIVLAAQQGPVSIEAQQIALAMRLENSTAELFKQVAGEIAGRFYSVIFYDDSYFRPNRDRIGNDIHAFFELGNTSYFHLRARIHHMMSHAESNVDDKLFLTAYIKDGIHFKGGRHAIRQDWYPCNAVKIAEELVRQCPDLACCSASVALENNISTPQTAELDLGPR